MSNAVIRGDQIEFLKKVPLITDPLFFPVKSLDLSRPSFVMWWRFWLRLVSEVNLIASLQITKLFRYVQYIAVTITHIQLSGSLANSILLQIMQCLRKRFFNFHQSWCRYALQLFNLYRWAHWKKNTCNAVPILSYIYYTFLTRTILAPSSIYLSGKVFNILRNKFLC